MRCEECKHYMGKMDGGVCRLFMKHTSLNFCCLSFEEKDGGEDDGS